MARGRADWNVGDVSRVVDDGGLCVEANAVIDEDADADADADAEPLHLLMSDCESSCDAT